MKLRAWIERSLSPNYGYCLRCRRPWKHGWIGVDEHVTDYSTERGCFPLCEVCWSALTPEQRLPYYLRLWRKWGSLADDEQWSEIRDAVMAGR